MKRKLVAFLLIMAVCGNLHTTVFAENTTNRGDEDWTPQEFECVSSIEIYGKTDSEAPKINTDLIPISGGSVMTEHEDGTITTETITGKSETEDNVINDIHEIFAGTVTTETSKDTEANGEVKDTDTAVNTVTNNSGNSGSTTENSSEFTETDLDPEFNVRTEDVSQKGSTNKTGEKKDEASTSDGVVEALRNEKIQQELKDYAKSIGFTDNRRYGMEAIQQKYDYVEKPVIGETSCIAGKLAGSTLKEGLDLINMIRKTAGLGEVTLDDTYNEYAQNGAMIMKASEGLVINGKKCGGLTHRPTKVDKVTEEQYELGFTGTTSGNIGWGHTSLTSCLLNGYMFDGSDSNIKTMGHRRWILNPTMAKVGFGQVEDYNCMYAHDNTNSEESIDGFVTWPAQNMPVELMSYMPFESPAGKTNSSMPWTCQLGADYKMASPKELTITVTYPDGHTYTIPQNKIFTNTELYGYTNGCITFRADDFEETKGFEEFGSNYSVKIDGVLDKNGNKTSIEYDVNFFNLF